MNKNLAKFVQYILPSNEQWTRVQWFVKYRELDLLFRRNGRMGDIYLVNNIWTIMLNHSQARLTKVPPVMSIFWALGKKPAPESWVWKSLVKAESKWCRQLTEGFWSDSVDTCIMASGDVRGNELWTDEVVGYLPVSDDGHKGAHHHLPRVLKFLVLGYSQTQA